MQKSLARKGLILGIIILFIGASVVPSISGSVKDDTKTFRATHADYDDLVQQTIDGGYIMINWSEQDKLIASDGESGDWFGISVSIDGDYAIVGARDDDGGKGSAYVFKRTDAAWSQEEKLTASDGAAGDWFGISVFIYGDYAFVGADADDNSNGVNAGSAYVFKRTGASWIEEAKLTASDGTANDYFGRSVSIDGDYAIIGAYYDNNIAGSAYVFKLTGENWMEEDKLTASDGEASDYFGITHSIEGEYVVIGAYRDDNSNGVDAGSVYVFKRTGTSWVEQVKLIALDGEAGDRFGIEVSMDGGYAIIGAYYDDANTGSAYMFKRTGEDWMEEDKLTASDGGIDNFFGRSVSIDGDYAIIGAWGDNSFAGSMYVFKCTGTSWVEQDKLIASDGESGDRFAYQVSIDGDYSIVGAYYDDNNNGVEAGSAYIFEKHAAPDLECEGELSWIYPEPGVTLTGQFVVKNVGDPGSLLNWEIVEWPDWGEWTFTPKSMEDLTPEDGGVTVDVEAYWPGGDDFGGQVKIVNCDNLEDVCIIDIYTTTPPRPSWHFLIGKIHNPEISNESVTFYADDVFVFRFIFLVNNYSNQQIILTNHYMGYIGDAFIFARFYY